MNEDDAVRVTLRGINRTDKKAQIKCDGSNHGRKRKPLYAVGSDRLILMGRYDSATYRKSKASPDVKEDILTPNQQPGEGKEFFYILAVTNVGKRLLVLECRIELLSNILRWTRKNILESEFNQK